MARARGTSSLILGTSVAEPFAGPLGEERKALGEATRGRGHGLGEDFVAGKATALDGAQFLVDCICAAPSAGASGARAGRAS